MVNKITAATCKKETQSSLGAAGPNVGECPITHSSPIVSPLHQVPRKKNSFTWAPEQQQAVEQIRHPNKTLVTRLLRCRGNGVSSVLLDGNEARQRGGVARDSAVDRGISRCQSRVATLWERVSSAEKERSPFKDHLEPEMKRWNTVDEGIRYVRETAVVEMLCDPVFVPNDPRQDRDPERVRSTPDIWRKLTRAAPERRTSTLVVTFDRYEDLQRRPPVFELILTLENFQEKLPPCHASISAISQVAERPDTVDKMIDEMEKKQDGMLEELSLLINCDEPVAVPEAPSEDQDDQKSLLKEQIKQIKISAKISADSSERISTDAQDDDGDADTAIKESSLHENPVSSC